MRPGTYSVQIYALVDNNQSDSVQDYSLANIFQYDVPSGDFADIATNNATSVGSSNNRPNNPHRYTSFGKADFIIKQQVKQRSYSLKGRAYTHDDVADGSVTASNPAYTYSRTKAYKGELADYSLNVYNDSETDIEKLTLVDVLPTNGDKAITDGSDRESKFFTLLISMDADPRFSVYYSVSAPKASMQEDANSPDVIWTSAPPADPGQLTMVKLVLNPGQKIVRGASSSSIMHCSVPDDNSLMRGDMAYNSFAVITDQDVDEHASVVETNKFGVMFDLPRKNWTLKKIDAQDGSALANVPFDLYEQENGGNFVKKATYKTNDSGLAYIDNLLVGKTYRLKEITAPDGYGIAPDTDFVVTTNTDPIIQDTVTVGDEKYVGVPVHVVLYHQKMEAAKFRFGLFDDNGQLVSNASNDADGFVYLLADSYPQDSTKRTYHIRQLDPQGSQSSGTLVGDANSNHLDQNMQYDSYDMTVDIARTAGGQLSFDFTGISDADRTSTTPVPSGSLFQQSIGCTKDAKFGVFYNTFGIKGQYK